MNVPPFLRLSTILGGLSLLAPAFAQAEDNGISYGELDALNGPSPLEREGLVETPGLLDGYYAWKADFAKSSGLNYLIEYGLISQWGSQAGDNFHADHELNVIGMWDLVDNPTFGEGQLMWWFQNAVTLGDATTSAFNQSLGALSPVNGGDTAPYANANRLQQLSWEQRLPDDRTRFMLGKLTTRVLMNLNRYAVSDREDFFSPMIVNNLVVPFTARLGLGAFVEHRTDDWYLSALIRDADAEDDFVDFDSPSSGNWEYASEIGLTPEMDGLGEGIYRITYHYTDAIGEAESLQPSGWSLSASFDQDIGESVGAFFRYAYADEAWRAFAQRAAIGAQLKGPFSHPDDRIGVAGWWGDPNGKASRDEYGLELFWKLQLTGNLELSPDLQVIFDPARAPSRDAVFAGGLRLRLTF